MHILSPNQANHSLGAVEDAIFWFFPVLLAHQEAAIGPKIGKGI
jgi:hypothetical protein